MTDDPEFTIQFSVLDIPYSAIKVPLNADIEDTMRLVSEWVSAYRDAFPPQSAPVVPPEYQTSPPPRQGAQRPPARPPSTQQGNRVTGEVVYCPDCNSQLSYYDNDQYAKWETGQDGLEYAQVFACTSQRCVAAGKKTKAVWRSKVVWPA